MIVKITSGLNLSVKILAIVLLVLEILKTVVFVSGAPSLRNDFIAIYMVAEVLFAFTTLYIAAVLNFFNEKRTVSAAFIVFTIIDFLLVMASIIVLFVHMKYMLIFDSLLSLISLFTALFIFVMALFVREKLIFGPILMFTISMLVLVLSGISAQIILPLINRLAPEHFISPLLIREIIGGTSIIAVLLPIAVILLTNRVNRFISSRQNAGTMLRG